MTPELQKYYEDSFTTFASDGWQHQLEDLRAMRDSCANLGGINTAEQLWFRKGQLDVLDVFINRREAMEMAHATILAEEAVSHEEQE